MNQGKAAGGSADTLLIRGVDVQVEIKMLAQADLRFFADNPRVYSIRRATGREPTQDEIQQRLLEMDHVKALIQDIKRDGGLTDPVIVRSGSLEVLEGNSRLAAYRLLAKGDPVKWGQMKCKVLPQDLDEVLVFALLGQYHIKGKKDWAPFDQAGFLYRRSRKHNIESKQLAEEIGLSRRKVEHLVRTYQFMLDHDEEEVGRWSYYDEYLKSRTVEKARLDHPRLDALVVEKIRSGEIGRAVDIRDRLPVICSARRVLRKFSNGAYDFEDAYDCAVDEGADSQPYKKLLTFRRWLVKQEAEEALGRIQGPTRDKVRFELDKIVRRIGTLRGRLKM